MCKCIISFIVALLGRQREEDRKQATMKYIPKKELSSNYLTLSGRTNDSAIIAKQQRFDLVNSKNLILLEVFIFYYSFRITFNDTRKKDTGPKEERKKVKRKVKHVHIRVQRFKPFYFLPHLSFKGRAYFKLHLPLAPNWLSVHSLSIAAFPLMDSVG